MHYKIPWGIACNVMPLSGNEPVLDLSVERWRICYPMKDIVEDDANLRSIRQADRKGS